VIKQDDKKEISFIQSLSKISMTSRLSSRQPNPYQPNQTIK
jgi:hypothetical protein